jgi:flagellar motility protein MotE (MotC chaperone)
VERREAFRKLAEETIVDIYARMRPDAAAVQLAALDAETAAAVLVRLNPRVASAIMAEMDTPRAVDLAAMIAAVGAPNPAETAKQ